MLLNTEICMAFKNPLGLYDITTISVFNMGDINLQFNSVMFNVKKNKEVEINIKCPICEERHKYTFQINEFINRHMVIGGCEIMGIPIFYIGKESMVREKVKKHKEINRKIHAMI